MAVSIDEDFARFDGKSYAINKINSVEVRERKPNGVAGAIVMGLIGLLCLFCSIASAGFILAAVIFLPLAYVMWRQSKVREYQLFVMTSSSEAQAFVTRDQSEVLALRQKIEGAMLRHSRAGTDR